MHVWQGPWFFHPFFLILPLLAIALIIRMITFRRWMRYGYYGGCGGPFGHQGGGFNPYEAEGILRKRLANGEISEEEYQRLKAALSK